MATERSRARLLKSNEIHTEIAIYFHKNKILFPGYEVFKYLTEEDYRNGICETVAIMYDLYETLEKARWLVFNKDCYAANVGIKINDSILTIYDFENKPEEMSWMWEGIEWT